MKLAKGVRYIVASFHPNPAATPNTRFTAEIVLRQPTIIGTSDKLRRFLAKDRPDFSPRCYEAEYLGTGEDGAMLFRPTLRLRLTEADRGEIADWGGVPGFDEVSAFLAGSVDALAPQPAGSPPRP